MGCRMVHFTRSTPHGLYNERNKVSVLCCCGAVLLLLCCCGALGAVWPCATTHKQAPKACHRPWPTRRKCRRAKGLRRSGANGGLRSCAGAGRTDPALLGKEVASPQSHILPKKASGIPAPCPIGGLLSDNLTDTCLTVILGVWAD